MKLKKEVDRLAAMVEPEHVDESLVKRLDYIKPPKINHFALQKGNELIDLNVPVLSEEEQYKKFRNKVDSLKKYYEPYLKNYVKVDSVNKTTQLVDFDYRRETEDDKADFMGVLNHERKWEKIKLPYYVGPDGEYNDYYFTKINVEKVDKNKTYYLKFEAADYQSDVYFNGRMVTSHLGFFNPFEIDVTDYVKAGENVLLIVLKNYFTTTGNFLNGKIQFGKKIYAATHFGYDEPKLGWHHCPPGIGIYGKVSFEERNKQFIDEILITPNIDNKIVSAKISIENRDFNDVKNTYLKISIKGRNFKEETFDSENIEYKPLSYNKNYINFEYKFDEFRLWTPDTPYLYEMIISLYNKDGVLLDVKTEHFGMRKFSIDENSKPFKGQFFFNNERIILNGCNEMGHLMLDVLRDNDDQLIEDILIAKSANLNYYRITQRPVLKKIYDYFDMLGMFVQTDFPLFNAITPDAHGECLKQVIDMEKLVFNHPSCIIDSLMNEAVEPHERGIDQYVYSRVELEKILETMRDTIHIINPGKVVKVHEGDCSPLENSQGLTDEHLYTYWYICGGIPAGMFEKGYFVPTRTDWMCGCGEYGADGLDGYELMKKYYPKEWLPKSVDEPWVPNRIPKAQCWAQLSDFVPEQEKILDWIKVSQEYQKFAIKRYVLCLRNRIDFIQSRAVHLLIDAWPAGWTKTLLDCDRIPKPAFYIFAECNIPYRIFLRRDRYTLYSGETAITEVYALNDSNKDQEGNLVISTYFNGVLNETINVDLCSDKINNNYSGDVLTKIPEDFEGNIKVVARLTDKNKNETFDEVEYRAVKKDTTLLNCPELKGERVQNLKVLFGNELNKNVMFVDDSYYVKHKEEIETDIQNGKRVVLFFLDSITVFNDRLSLWTHPDRGMTKSNNWLMLNRENEFVKEFDEMDFRNFYNSKTDYQDLTAWFKFYWPGAEMILFTRHDRGNPEFQFHKEPKLVCGRKKIGKGELIATTLTNIDGFVNYNYVFDKFIKNLTKYE